MEKEKKVTVADGDIADEKGTMRKKILLLVLLLLCVGALIALVVIHSGTPLVDFWAVSGPIAQDKTEIVSVEKVEDVSGQCTGRVGRLALYEDVNADGKKVQRIVHIVRKEVLASLTDTDNTLYTVKLYGALGDSAWYALFEQTAAAEPVYRVSLYDEGGKAFAEKKDITSRDALNTLYSPILDLVCFDREVYRIDARGNAKSAFTLGTFAELPVFDEKIADHYYHTETDAKGVTCWYVDNNNAELTAIYRAPTEALDVRSFVLSDGTLFTQYVTEADASVAEYTFVAAGVKYCLHHDLLNVRTGERTALKEPTFYIAENGILSEDSELRARGLNASMDNLIMGYPIVNGTLDMNDHTLRAALFSNRGRITSFVGDIIPAMYGGGIFGVAKNRWVARNLADEYFLLNEWGTVIGRFPAFSSIHTVLASKLFVHEGGIYNWDLALLYDMDAEGVVDFEIVGSSVLLRKAEGEVLLYDGTKQAVISLAEKNSGKKVSTEKGSSLILVEGESEGQKSFAVYNECGKLLITLAADRVDVVAHTVDGASIAELTVTSGVETALYIASTED